jgi:hypothetical protein
MRQNETSVDHELICFHHAQTIKSECGAYIATLLNGTNIPILTNVINGSVDVGSGAAYVSNLSCSHTVIDSQFVADSECGHLTTA